MLALDFKFQHYCKPFEAHYRHSNFLTAVVSANIVSKVDKTDIHGVTCTNFF